MTIIDLFKLTGKTAFVTGGAKGLGRKINEGLLEAEIQNLIFCGRGIHGSVMEEEDRLTNLFPNTGIFGVQCDIGDESQLTAMVNKIKNNFDIKNIDILINNAGVTWAAPSVDQTMKSWHRVIDTNLTGTFLVTRDIAREFMIPFSKGSIINISSLLAIQGVALMSQVGYSASKAGLLGLTRQLAIEWSTSSIRVNAIAPIFVEGDSMSTVFTNESSPVRGTLIDQIPLKRFVQPEDLQSCVCFLASDASSYITGQTIILDGGYSIR